MQFDARKRSNTAGRSGQQARHMLHACALRFRHRARNPGPRPEMRSINMHRTVHKELQNWT